MREVWLFAIGGSSKTRFRLTTSETTKSFNEEKCVLVQSFLVVNALVVVLKTAGQLNF